MKNDRVYKLSLSALFAALCYIGFAYFKIDIPVGDSKTAFHLGNVFCVLAALFIGPFWGGLSGAVGMTIADLTSGYDLRPQDLPSENVHRSDHRPRGA